MDVYCILYNTTYQWKPLNVVPLEHQFNNLQALRSSKLNLFNPLLDTFLYCWLHLETVN